MRNSPLVSYTRLSPNCTKPRNHEIDTITIHCMAGDLSVEGCGEVFASPARQASSNYGIGSDGRIALYVDEGDRSWCSSSKANDHRAVTIEVANTVAAHPWPVSQAAYKSLVDLVTDICRRNGIERLVWSTDKNDRVNHREGCNMTVHRDYAAKACPGDYLYNLHGQIAAEVNCRLNQTETKEPKNEMTAEEFIEKLTDEQAYGLLLKAYRHCETLEEPLWSQADGHWAKARELGVTDGTSPERPMKRCEVIAVLGRKGLL